MAEGMRTEEGSKADITSVRVRLFVGGLAPGVSSKDLTGMLDRLGRVHRVDVPARKQVWEEQPAGSHRGFVHVEFEASEAALAKLMSVYNGCKWRGGKLRIERAKEHFLTRLQREWDADSQAEADDAAQDSSFSETLDTESLKRQLSLPGLNMKFPNAKKLRFVPLKGLGKHKYSFRREESLPLRLLPLSIDEKLVIEPVPRQEHCETAADAGPQRQSKGGADARPDRFAAQQLSAEELEECLKVERQRQLELLSKLFPGDAGLGSSSTKEVAERPTDTSALKTESLPRKRKKILRKDAGKKSANSVASPWTKLFEAAAGVGVKSDISDSEISDLEEEGEGGDEYDEDPENEDVNLAREVEDAGRCRSGKVKRHPTSKKVTWKGLDEHTEDVAVSGKFQEQLTPTTDDRKNLDEGKGEVSRIRRGKSTVQLHAGSSQGSKLDHDLQDDSDICDLEVGGGDGRGKEEAKDGIWMEEGYKDADLAENVVDGEDCDLVSKFKNQPPSKTFTSSRKGLEQSTPKAAKTKELDEGNGEGDRIKKRKQPMLSHSASNEGRKLGHDSQDSAAGIDDKQGSRLAAATGREEDATSLASYDGSGLKRATVLDMASTESEPPPLQKRSRLGSEPEFRQAPAAERESKQEKWNKLFEAAAYVPASGLVLNIEDKMDEVVPGESAADETSPSISGAVIPGTEATVEKWRRVFEVAAGVAGTSGTEPPSGQTGLERNVVGGSSSSEVVPSLSNEAKVKTKAKPRSQIKKVKGVRGSSDMVKATTGPRADRQSVQATTDPGIVTPQVGGGTASGSHPDKLATTGGEAGGKDNIVEAGSGVDPTTQPLELDREAVGNPTVLSEVVSNSAPVSPPSPGNADDENAKWMQKASWKSLVGVKGVVGFSLGRTLGFNFPVQDTQAQLQAEEQGMHQEKREETSPTGEWQAGSSLPASGSFCEAAEARTSPWTRDAAPAAMDDRGVEVCTFMRSESAHRDWAASRARLKEDCRAKHKAAVRLARKMRPTARLL